MTDFESLRAQFHMPDGLIYLDGNSLGPLTTGARQRVIDTLDREWGGMLVGGWRDAGWIDLAGRVGERIGRLIGAPTGSVSVGDSISVNLFKLLAAALDLRPDRKVILSEDGNFPTDLYIAQGIIRHLGRGHELVTVPHDRLEDSLDKNVALLMLTQVNYRSGRLHDMAALTERAHEVGAVALWDLAHSAGALPIDLAGTGADMAVGCGYKYLNGGPGAPAFLYVAPQHQDRIAPVLSGWLGHADPFAFGETYRPAPGILRMQAGTPPILSLAALDAALDLFDAVSVDELRARSLDLSQVFLERVEARCPRLQLATPRDPDRRGSQVSFHCADGYPVVQAMIAEGVICDFREPDIMRFGFAPLYVREADVLAAADTLQRILAERLWDRPEYKVRDVVT